MTQNIYGIMLQNTYSGRSHLLKILEKAVKTCSKWRSQNKNLSLCLPNPNEHQTIVGADANNTIPGYQPSVIKN
jgi:hypothetical protein